MDLLTSDVMNRAVISCLPDTRLEDVVQALAENSISGLPVIDAQRKVLGIISEGDLLLADEMEAPRMKTALFGLYLLPEGVVDKMAEARGILARDVMKTDVVTCTPDTPVRDVVKILSERRIKRLPVVDEAGKLVGIISRADIIRAIAQLHPAT
jgi:CBS domain-containing protein